jgi:mono/diheme cytochrome c family protein
MTPGQCWRSALIGALACGALVFMTLAAGQTQPDAAAGGKQLYFQHGCYGCHGFNGETGNAPHLAGSPILANAQTFIAFLRLRAGYRPLLPSTSMPSFSASDLSDADALELYGYVHAFVLHAPDPQGIAAFQTILQSAQGTYKPPP